MASTSADATRAPHRVRQRADEEDLRTELTEAQAQLGEAQHEQGHALLRIEDHGRRLVNELRAQEEAVQADAAMLNQQTRLEINILDARLKQVEMDSKRLQGNPHGLGRGPAHSTLRDGEGHAARWHRSPAPGRTPQADDGEPSAQ